MSERARASGAMTLLSVLAAGCAGAGGGAKHDELCQSYCELIVADLDACEQLGSGCHLESAVFSEYVADCADDCVDGFTELSAQEKQGVEGCLTCVVDQLASPACGDVAAALEDACDGSCDANDMEEFHAGFTLDAITDDDLEC
jgi:hypothetical protein